MDDNESYTAEDLEKCSYRYLQQVAKTMKLPANVKKVHLINMIHAKKYSSTTDFQNIVDNVCNERKQVSRMRKVKYRKQIKIQGKEVTSTCRYSPSGAVSPEHTGHIVIRCPENTRRSIMKSLPMQTDRVLRSTGREPGKYRFLNTVIGVIKSQNRSANTQTHTISSPGRQYAEKRHKFVINKFKTNIRNCNQSVLKINEEKTNLQVYSKKPGPVTSTPLPSKRLRTISGIYPLNPTSIEPQLSYSSTKSINFRRQDGTISRINLSQPNFNDTFENFLVNKNQNQVTVTVQDIINSNIEEQVFSNTNMTEFLISDSEQQKNIDYPNMSMVTETTTFINQPTLVLENPVLNQTKVANLNENIKKIRNLLKERQSLRIEIPNPEVPTYNGSEELKNLLLMKQPVCYSNNQHKTYQSEPSFVVNQTKYPKLQLNSNIPLSSCNTDPLNSNVAQLNCSLPQLTNNSLQFNNNLSQLDNNSIQLNNNSLQFNNNSSQLNNNLPQLNSNLSQLNTNLSQLNNNSTQTTSNVTQSISAENQSMFENDSYGFSVYYHKKIRAEQVRSKRNTYQRQTSREDDCLPKINQVFSRFNSVGKECTQPLYMQVNDESERTLSNQVCASKTNSTSILESLYNFKNTFITNTPLVKVVTTSNTKCVYSTPIISTPIAQSSFEEHVHFPSQEPDRQQLNTESNRNSLPRIEDCLLEDQVHMRREFTRDMSDLSSTSDSLSHDPNVSIPEMVEDALELISQDGDYMERINMDIRMQCFLCNWAGPRIILECHVRKEHSIQTVSLNGSWRVVFTLTSLRNVWNSRVLEKNEQLYIISAKWEDKCLFATLTTISAYELTPKLGLITFFNRITLEHVTWQGEIRQLHSNMPYENHSEGLTLNFNNTDVFENNSALNECFFTFFVKVND